MNSKLRHLFQDDQAERIHHPPYGTPEYQAMRERDRVHRQQVQELIAAGALHAPEDYYHAAMIFQHGESVEEIWQAYLLAIQSADLGYLRSKCDARRN